MGIMDFIKGQLLDVIEMTDESQDTMVYRFPMGDKEIMMNAQLTVRESQAAVFVNEGQIADVFGPGKYTITTQNLPLLTVLKSWKYGFNSPFKAEVYFVNTKQFTDRKWGTSNPVIMSDPQFGMIRLRAFGIYSFRVNDPAVFLKEVFGTNSMYNVSSITGQLKRSIVSGVSDMLGEFEGSILDYARNYDELSQASLAKIQDRFTPLGLKLVSFFIENVSLPEEVEKMMDTRTSMGVIGDMNTFTQFHAAQAIRDAAQNEGGGLAAAGVGLGAGATLGHAFANSMNPQGQGGGQPPASTPPQTTCPHCNAPISATAKFCPECGKQTVIPKANCVECGAEIKAGSKFCPECGASQEAKVCPNCKAEAAPGAKFCNECGTKL